jgi:hypothetical protein
MAIFDIFPGASWGGQRGGVVGYNNGPIQLGRVATQPLIPKSSPQGNATNNLAIAAYIWSQMLPAAQAVWNALATPAATGYSLFAAYYMYRLIWGGVPDGTSGPPGSFPIPVLPLAAAGSNSAFGAAFQDPVDGLAKLAFWSATPTDPTRGLWGRLYVDPAFFIVSWVPGGSGGSAVNVPNPAGYVYIGSVGPCIPDTFQWTDITAPILKVAGQMPQTWTFPYPLPLMEGGSIFNSLIYWTTDIGENLFPVGTIAAEHPFNGAWSEAALGPFLPGAPQIPFYPAP